MVDKRARASIKKVQEEIAPFVKKHIFGRDSIDANNIPEVAGMLLKQYNNISITQGLDQGKDGKPWLKITIKSFSRSEEIILEVIGTTAKK